MRLQSRLMVQWCIGLLVCGVAAFTTGCVSPCPAAKQIGGVGVILDVSFLEKYSPQSAYAYDGRTITSERLDWSSCAGRDGLAPGAVMRIRTVGEEPLTSCNGLVLDVISGPEGLPVLRRPSGVREFLGASYATQLGGCPGTWTLRFLEVREGDVLAAPIPGQAPPVVAIRTFAPATSNGPDDGCAGCFDAFVVQLDKR